MFPVFTRVIQLFANPLTYEAAYPSERAKSAAAHHGLTADVSDATHVSWVQGLGVQDSKFFSVLQRYYEGEFFEEIRTAVINVPSMDHHKLLAACPNLTSEVAELSKLFQVGDAGTRNVVMASATPGLTSDFAGELSPFLGSDAHNDDMELDPAQAKKRAQSAMIAKASSKRASVSGFIELAPTASKQQLMSAIENHTLFQTSQKSCSWGKKHILFLIDPACGPESQKPTIFSLARLIASLT